MTHGSIVNHFARSGRASRAASIALVVLIAACGLSCASIGPQAKPERVAAVAIPDRFGADAAQDVLARGGNAVDAAIAVAFVLAVTYPEAGNLGGGGFMLIYDHGKPAFLDYRETAPAAASRDMYLDKEGNVIRGASTVGWRASGVPGTVAGMWAAHQRYGSMPWKDLLAPAIALARDGFLP